MIPDNHADPFELFGLLFAEARKRAESHDATAVALATADRAGRPAVRMVLLKGVDQDGFVFFTNYGSRKGQQLAENPQAALCFYWPALGVQVRAEGRVARISDAESDDYFATRPRGSQLAAWASNQSAPLAVRQVLLDRYKELDERYADRPVPRPPFWGGYRLTPDRIEFWESEAYRMHDRLLYTRDEAAAEGGLAPADSHQPGHLNEQQHGHQHWHQHWQKTRLFP